VQDGHLAQGDPLADLEPFLSEGRVEDFGGREIENIGDDSVEFGDILEEGAVS